MEARERVELIDDSNVSHLQVWFDERFVHGIHLTQMDTKGRDTGRQMARQKH